MNPNAPAHIPGSDRRLALRVITMPKETNQYGTIFGGVILSYIDQAGFVEARRHGSHRWVTAAMDRIEFKAPVGVGDVVNFYTSTVRRGTRSVTVRVEVEAERYLAGAGGGDGGQTVPVTGAVLVMVSVGADGKPIAFDSPASV
jgi:acyl-CoA thioesterase YciA